MAPQTPQDLQFQQNLIVKMQWSNYHVVYHLRPVVIFLCRQGVCLEGITVFHMLGLFNLVEMLFNEINCSEGDCMLEKHCCLDSCDRDIKKQARMGI